MPLGPHLELSDAWGRFVGAVRGLWEAESSNTNRPQLVHYKLLVEEALSLGTDPGLVAAMQDSFLKRLPDARAAAPIRFYILGTQSVRQRRRRPHAGGIEPDRNEARSARRCRHDRE